MGEEEEQGHIFQLVNRKLEEELVVKLEEKLKEGLAMKGHTFETEEQLKQFAKARIKIKHYIREYCKVWLVDDIPFFMHYYDKRITQPIDSMRMEMNYGYYKFM